MMAGLNSDTVTALDFSLDAIQQSIEDQYQDISHVDGYHIVKLNTEKTIIFDVRQQPEFEVSHLDNAIRIAPNINSKDFMSAFGDQIEGKNIVFYCSVGRRSSILASRLKPSLLKQGAKNIYNLRGGIFKWRNEQRALIQNERPTQYIHPFNPLWGLLIEDQSAIRLLPEQALTK